jgi:protein SCO1/2
MKMKPVSLLLLATCLGCTHSEDSLPFFNTADFKPEWIVSGSSAYADIHTVPPFSFINQDGDTVTDKTIEGRIVVADFFFTICPGICPRLTRSMGMIQETFDDDRAVMLLSHSVTPDMDDVPRLKVYADAHHVKSGKWHLLTGDRSMIYRIARSGYFADEDLGLTKSESEFLHTENFVLIDGRRRIRGVYNGTNPAEVERLIEDIRILKKETHS